MMEIELVNRIESVLHDVEQRSEEWFALRLGKITSSLYDDLMPAKSKAIDSFNETQLKILKELAVQRMTGTIEDSFTSKHMERGTEEEPKAIDYYELTQFKIITPVGFYTFLDFGDSPDGVILNDRAIEIKNPKTTTHYDYYLDPESLFNKYKWQGYGHMIASGLLKCDYISFDDRFKDDKKMVIYTENYKQQEADKLLARLAICEAKIQEFCNA